MSMAKTYIVGGMEKASSCKMETENTNNQLKIVIKSKTIKGFPKSFCPGFSSYKRGKLRAGQIFSYSNQKVNVKGTTKN